MIALVFTGCLYSCQQEISIEGFESQKWAEDAHGCKGYREKMAALLMEHRKQLIGANEKEVKNLLGMPDAQELQTRGQHYFVYELRGGKSCLDEKQSALLRIRFDALNRVSELAVY